jgi:hypothetical protein
VAATQGAQVLFEEATIAIQVGQLQRSKWAKPSRSSEFNTLHAEETSRIHQSRISSQRIGERR